MKSGIELIAEERSRQQAPTKHGGEYWTARHDDEHANGELAEAAASYVLAGRDPGLGDIAQDIWPWEPAAFKPKDPIRNLARAGALCAAEIDRRQRLEQKTKPAANFEI